MATKVELEQQVQELQETNKQLLDTIRNYQEQLQNSEKLYHTVLQTIGGQLETVMSSIQVLAASRR